jgi:hypothetical protein
MRQQVREHHHELRKLRFVREDLLFRGTELLQWRLR